MLSYIKQLCTMTIQQCQVNSRLVKGALNLFEFPSYWQGSSMLRPFNFTLFYLALTMWWYNTKCIYSLHHDYFYLPVWLLCSLMRQEDWWKLLKKYKIIDEHAPCNTNAATCRQQHESNNNCLMVHWQPISEIKDCFMASLDMEIAINCYKLSEKSRIVNAQWACNNWLMAHWQLVTKHAINIACIDC